MSGSCAIAAENRAGSRKVASRSDECGVLAVIRGPFRAPHTTTLPPPNVGLAKEERLPGAYGRRMGADCCSRLGFINALAVTAYGAAAFSPVPAGAAPAAAGTARQLVDAKISPTTIRAIFLTPP